MTEEEKKEFEEFLQWKREKAAKEEQARGKEANTFQEEKNSDSEKLPANADAVAHNSNLDSIESSGSGVVILCAILFSILLIFLLARGCNNNNSSRPSTAFVEAEEEIDTVVPVVVDDVAPEPQKVEWDFTISTDAMTDTKNIWAEIKSDNYIIQDFPYEGLTYAKLTVRYMKKYGYDVIVEITKGQINGSRYNGTNYITARFDEGNPKKYFFNEAADGSPEYVFLTNKQDFIKRCKQAKDIKIDIPVYQSGRPVFSFHVDEPLTWREE